MTKPTSTATPTLTIVAIVSALRVTSDSVFRSTPRSSIRRAPSRASSSSVVLTIEAGRPVSIGAGSGGFPETVSDYGIDAITADSGEPRG